MNKSTVFSDNCSAFKAKHKGQYIPFKTGALESPSTAVAEAQYSCWRALSGRNRAAWSIDEVNACVRAQCADGEYIALFLTDDSRIEAFAQQINTLHCICLNSGVANALWLLNLSIWSHSQFPEPGKNRVEEVLAKSEGVDTAIPRGLEGPWLFAKSRVAMDSRPKWVEPAIAALKRSRWRQAAFNRSFRASLAWGWLHELGHVLRGHTSTVDQLEEFFPIGSPDVKGTTSGVSHTPEDRWLAEMEADAFASLSMLPSTMKANSRSADQQLYDLALVTGVLSVQLLLHGVETVLDARSNERRHPPLWYRASQVRALASQSQLEFKSRARPSTLGAPMLSSDTAGLAVSALSRLHHYFGEFFAGSEGPELQSYADRYQSDVRAKAGQAFDKYRHNRKTLGTSLP